MSFGVKTIYPTAEALQNKIDEYFDYCFVYENKYGRLIPKAIIPPTFSGLARYLGFPSRINMINFIGCENSEVFEDILSQAMLRIEEYYEGKLVSTRGNTIGLQFALKNNCGWEDTNKTQLTAGGESSGAIVFQWGVDDNKTIDAEIIESIPAPMRQIVSEEEKIAASEERFDKESDEPSAQDLTFDFDF